LRFVALVSGGLDSPVAAYLVGRQPKAEVIPVHFDNYPLSERVARVRAVKCCSRLAERIGIREMYVIPYGQILSEFVRDCERRLVCVLCKRMMLRIAERFAEEVGAGALVTGESLGQVASQTLTNIRVEDAAVRIPVFRPLVGLDKREIVDLAREIGTYEVSIIPAGCCGGSPSKPATKAKLERVVAEEGKVDVVAFVSRSLEGRERVELPV